MRINKKNRINVKKVLGIIIAFTIVITSIISPNISIVANAAEAKSTSNEDEVINIHLQWSKNNMSYVNSYYGIHSNIYASSTNYFNMLSAKNESSKHLLSPEHTKNMENGLYYDNNGLHYGWHSVKGYATNKTGNILRTPMLIDPTSNPDDLYTIDYRDLEKWFEPPNPNGREPISLRQTDDVWNYNKNFAIWKQTSNSEYTTQDWYMFRGIVDENEFKKKGITADNIGDYEFYLAMPDGKMILGANDLISVFVDEYSTEINYATPSLYKDGNREINFKVRNGKGSNSFVNKKITYKNLSTDRHGGKTDDSNIHGNRGLNLGPADGWHIDLNDLEKDGKGNVVLGDVTNIIKQNVYGDNRHMIDMLASEWCGDGGMTSLALYAVKKPTLNVEKIAYVESKDEDKINKSDIKSKEGNEIILNTDNNIPSIPANVPVYFKFKLKNTGQITLNNIQFKDEMLNNITYDNKNLHGANIVDSSGKSSDLNKLMPGQSITLEDEKHLKYDLRDSKNYSDLNNKITNTVEASGTYFDNQLTVKDSSSVSFKTYFEPNISVKKTLVNINGKDVDYDKDKQPLVAGDNVRFKISVTNNSDMAIGGLSLTDTLKNDGKVDLTNWTFTPDSKDKDINPNNFTLDKGQTVNFYTEWKVTNTQESKGSNIAYININGCKEKFPSNEVDFSIKDKEGTINVTKQVNKKFDKNKSQYSDLTQSDKDEIKDQLFTINLIDNTDGTVQTIAIKNGQTAQFTGLKYGHRYTIKESIPMNYKLESIKVNEDKSDTFTMGFDTDNSKVTVTNSYSDNGWFEWYENLANKLKTASNL